MFLKGNVFSVSHEASVALQTQPKPQVCQQFNIQMRAHYLNPPLTILVTFVFQNPKSELQKLLQIADKHSSPASATAEHLRRSGGRTPCHSFPKEKFPSTSQGTCSSQPSLAPLPPPQQKTALLFLGCPSRLQTEFVLVPKGIQMSKKGGDTVKCFVIHYTTPLFPGRFGLGWHQISQSRLFCLASGLSFQQGALCVCTGVLAELLPQSIAQDRGKQTPMISNNSYAALIGCCVC